MTDLITSDDVAPRAPIEVRTAELVGVSYADRIIELVAAPYNVDASVMIRGEWVTESFDPAAFIGVERRANRIRVNRDHDRTRTVGRAIALHPSRECGLVTELRIARSVLGDETLALADEGCLDASAGFAVMPGGEQWLNNRTRRRVTKAFLDHIAMTPDPAYETATVLSVRHSDGDDGPEIDDGSTPRKDEVLARLAAVGYRPPVK